LHLLNAHLAELHRILSDYDSSELTAEFFLCALLAPAQFPPSRASQNSLEILSATVSLLHSLASKVFSNLEVFPELLIAVPVSQHVFV
jgi:hypothetical protein